METKKKKQEEKKKETTWKDELFSWIKMLTIAMIIGLGISSVLKPTIVSGSSMYPSLEDRDYLMMNRLAYKIGEPKHHDVIVFETKTDSVFIKRVIGIAGDKVKVKDGKVWVNDIEQEEPFINGEFHKGDVEVIVPEDHLFVMGDNRDNSFDSRFQEIGFIHEDDVIGKVFIQLFPFEIPTTNSVI